MQSKFSGISICSPLLAMYMKKYLRCANQWNMLVNIRSRFYRLYSTPPLLCPSFSVPVPVPRLCNVNKQHCWPGSLCCSVRAPSALFLATTRRIYLFSSKGRSLKLCSFVCRWACAVRSRAVWSIWPKWASCIGTSPVGTVWSARTCSSRSLCWHWTRKALKRECFSDVQLHKDNFLRTRGFVSSRCDFDDVSLTHNWQVCNVLDLIGIHVLLAGVTNKVWSVKESPTSTQGVKCN